MAEVPADPYACNSTAQLLASLEKGDFDALVFADLRDLVAAMRDHAADVGIKNKVKGKLTITLDLTLLGDAFDAMNMARTMRIHENSKVEQTTKRESGQENLIYTTEHTDDQGQKFEPKTLFLLSIPIFEQGPKYLLPILVSYKLRGSASTWSYKMYRHDLAVNDAIQTACNCVATETNLPLIYGTPEMRGKA
jgi:hypothetical protein